MENYGHILVSHIQTQIPSSIKMVLRFHIHVFYQYTHLERLYLKHKRDRSETEVLKQIYYFNTARNLPCLLKQKKICHRVS